MRSKKFNNKPNQHNTIKLNSPKPPWIRLTFDGSKLKVISLKSGRVLEAIPATSGLPPNAPHIQELIKKGRKDLDPKKDYRKPEYQDVADAGPIPQGTYKLPLTSNMSYQKRGGGWGEGAWLLRQSFFASAKYKLLVGRGGFFIHEDGGNPGTAGCIGVKTATEVLKLKQIFKDSHKSGQTEVDVTVEYEEN